MTATPERRRRNITGAVFGQPEEPGIAVQTPRLRRTERREVLVDAAAALVARGDLDAVSMEAVAAHAGVSRPLVYKHFANRSELLAAVFRREAAALDAEIVAAVQRAEGFEGLIRALIRAALEGAATRGEVFISLLRAGAYDAGLRREQRSRDRRSLRFFTRMAMEEFALPEAQARAAMVVLLGAIASVVAQWRRRPDRRHQRFLEDLYVSLVMGGLSRLEATPASPDGDPDTAAR